MPITSIPAMNASSSSEKTATELIRSYIQKFAQEDGTSNGAVLNYSAARRKIKILFVDDNQTVSRSVMRLLKMSGHEVASAFDGQSALRTARDFQVDAVLLHLNFP